MRERSFHRNRTDQNRLVIVALDGIDGHLRAQFNPAEVQVEQASNWEAQETIGSAMPHQHHKGSAPRTMTLELFFDCYELKGASLDDDLSMLNRMALAPDPESREDEQRRPPLLEVMNCPIPGFRCVLESVSIKVTMFDRAMRPVRATASIKLKEIARGDLPSPKLPEVTARRANYSRHSRDEMRQLRHEQRAREAIVARRLAGPVS